MKKYFWNILIAIDQLANTILGGDPDETISSRLGKWSHRYKHSKDIRKYIAKYLGYILNKIDTNHIEKSIEPDEGDDSVID